MAGKKKDYGARPTTMRLPDDLKMRIKRVAQQEGRTASNLTKIMLEEGLARRHRRRQKSAGEAADGSVFS